jgi:Tol biopolymer transport system component
MVRNHLLTGRPAARVRALVGTQSDVHLWSVRLSDGRWRRLTRTPGLSEVDPAWSPDGDSIAFSLFRGGCQEISTMPAGGGAARAVTHSSRDRGLQQPVWRP